MKSIIHWLTHWPNLSWWWTKTQLKTRLLVHVILNPRGNQEILVDENVHLVMGMDPKPIEEEPADFGLDPTPMKLSNTAEERKHRDHMIVAKRLAGRTLGDIARWAGLSPARVHQILKAKGCTDEYVTEVRERSAQQPLPAPPAGEEKV